MATVRRILNLLAIIGVTFAIVRASSYIETVIKERETLQPSFILVDITEHTRLAEKWYGYTEETIGWTLIIQNTGDTARNVNITIPKTAWYTDYEPYVGKAVDVTEQAYYEIIGPQQVFAVYIDDLYHEILVKYDGGQQTIEIWEETD